MNAWRSKCRAAKSKVACWRSSSFARNKKKDGYTEAEFVNLTLKAFDKVENFLRRVIYTDEANYHKNGHVKWNTHGAWGQKRRYDIYEHAWDSSKVNVRWSKTRDCVTGPFVIAEKKYFLLGFIRICWGNMWFHKVILLNAKEKMKFCFYRTALHSASVMTYEMTWKPCLISGGSEKADKSRGISRSPHFSPLVSFFLCRLIKVPFPPRRSVIYFIHAREI